MTNSTIRRPLDGMLVLDLGQIYNGPYCGLQLSFMGARVLKIEPPLTVTSGQIAQVIDVVGAIFDEYRALPKLLAHVTARISRRGLARL